MSMRDWHRYRRGVFAALHSASFGLWVLGYALLFVASISGVWGWGVVGFTSWVSLLILVFDDWKAIKQGLMKQSQRSSFVFACYVLSLSAVACFLNIALLIRAAINSGS